MKIVINKNVLYELYGQKNALINVQTDILERIEKIQTQIDKLEPPRKKRNNSNVY